MLCTQMSHFGISRGEWCGTLRGGMSPVHSAWPEDVMPLRQVASESAARQEHLWCASSASCVRRASQSSALCACLKYPGGCATGQVKSLQASAPARDVSPGPSACEADVKPFHHYHLLSLRIVRCAQPEALWQVDTLGFEPRAFRMRSGCDTTTPCALEFHANRCLFRISREARGPEHSAGI